ncbi:MAG: alkaline-phosphatase-like protein [Olpidium bornovanus]|uniref:Alkaline phosphatase n=1 Tax=Olpidium bornovanus TaxID=278681 RepID=A0A8H7ZRU6_9FUNG|nr:MAG: alkaline-phosphatase-like protein [Olpidium bornovanus]
MPLDTILVGQSRTRSTSSLVTDSAAGATAFSCAKKTYNAAIAVDDERVPCGTVLEAAKAKGMITGLVATSRITHATPAAFSAHVVHRDMENEIARQQVGNYVLGRQVDLLLGGGRCHFMHSSLNGSCRADDDDVWKDAQDAGWKFIQTRKEFDEIDRQHPPFPLAGLFTLDHMSYEIDRNPNEEPSLKEMAAAALSMLQTAAVSIDKGFFVMIEGSRIDMAAHSNDPAAHVHDILQYQETIAFVKSWVDDHPGTVMISVSDHETGGLTLARQVSSAYPEYLWCVRCLKFCRY